jgi:hypothetical protein
MKALITNVEFEKEWYSEKYKKTYYIFNVSYNNKVGQYLTTKREQTYFKIDEVAEFTEEEREFRGEMQYKVKPIKQNTGNSNFSRALKKEQSKYSGFADSYVKDLLNAQILKPEFSEEDKNHNDVVMITWKERSFEIFEHMVQLDKTLES